MDVDDPCGTDNFYDEIDSFMPPPGDYNLDDIDEILRSTNPELDATLDFTNELYNFNIKNEFQPIEEPTTFGLSNFNGTEALQQPTRNDSISSMEAEHFNPDEFMNLLNSDNMKFSELTATESDYSNNSMEDALQRHRNTPSPTGSCSSSGGSSTSGVQSDVSSVGSMTPAYNTQTMHLESNENELVTPPTIYEVPITVSIPAIITPAPATFQTAAVTPQPQIIQLPAVKKLPIKPLSIVKPTIPAPVKIEPKLAPKQTTTPNVKLITATNNNSSSSNAKVTTPTNGKPKTIILSSNDFKTLMQRMNSNNSKNAGNSNGAKISGAISAAQMPKIIMKTANGKVITSNKIVQPMSKIVNTSGANGGLLLKQHNQTVKTESNNNNSIYKGLIDEKLFKKQQRMIKNRESASLSRKKKKEYVVSLETRINNLEKENYSLKGENKSLRSQLVALAQTCNCKNGNVSEFILNSLNAAENKSQPVKIAPKPTTKSLKQRMTAANIRKNVAVLFAMAFMVSLNVGNFQNFLNKNSLESSGMAEPTPEEPLAPQVATASAGRRLLWVETEAEYNEKLNRSKRESFENMPAPPPLHFLRPINRTSQQQQQQQMQQNGTQKGIMNQTTENLRLASSLRKWIGGNANYLNLTLDTDFGQQKFDDDLENPTGFKATSHYYDMKSYDLPLQQGNGPGLPKRKLFLADDDDNANTVDAYGKQRKLNEGRRQSGLENSLDLFKPKISEEYLRLFRGIKRQDDTFYVLSFNMDHILLPASNYNKSVRPKMSLMLPAGTADLNGDITLMQIDCEVTNTTELMLKSFMIPEKLRPTTAKFTKNPNDVANNETNGSGGGGQEEHKQQPKENRFYTAARRASAASATTVDDGNKTVLDKLVVPKQKSVVQTIYLMGPKTQAAADAAKKKPTIIKLSGNETVINGKVNGKVLNSTLYAKMRETVEKDNAL